MTKRLVPILLGLAAVAAAGDTKKLRKPHRLHGVAWHRTLDLARKAAAQGRTARPILWLRMLGDLAGKT